MVIAQKRAGAEAARVSAMRLRDKVAIVTGATSGIGKATALFFAREGAKVVLAGRTVEAGEQVAKSIRSDGGEAVYVRTDIADTTEVEHLISTAVDTYGKLDVLFNNAGTDAFDEQGYQVDAEWDRVMSVNLKGHWWAMRCAGRYMIENGSGSIINNASMWGTMASHRGTGGCYQASKGGLIMLTRQFALEYAQYRIRVNSVSASDVATPMTGFLEEHWDDPAILEHWKALQPLPEVGSPDHVALATLFLASDESSFVTGINLIVDGGASLAEYNRGEPLPYRAPQT